VLLMNPQLAGTTLEDASREDWVRGLYLRALSRGGQQIPIAAGVALQRGDLLRIVGPEPVVQRAEAKIGANVAAGATIDFVVLGLAIFIGGVVGVLVTFSVGGIKISLGTSIGTLLAGLLVGHLRTRHPWFGRISDGAVSIRMYTPGSFLGGVAGELGLTNAWTGEGDPDYGLAQTDVEGLTGLGGDVHFLYVGNESSVVRFPYTPGQTAARGPAQRIASLPSGGHSTRNVIFNRDRSKLYVAVGSEGNVNIERRPIRAAITEMNPDGTGARIFASGLRNPVGLAIEPRTQALWTSVNERDGLGDELVPDYLTSVQQGDFYGWPYAYLGQHEEPSLKGKRPDLVAKAKVPDVLFRSHSAPLGLLFYTGTQFPAQYRGGAFVAHHGSWNASNPRGYKIVYVPFQNGRPAGGYNNFALGFWTTGNAPAGVMGRPVGLAQAKDGSLLVADDVGNTVWRISYSGR